MKDRYDLRATKYICNRSKCGTIIEIESESFYWFGRMPDGVSYSPTDDPNFWCPSCNDFPLAEILGSPADDLPLELQHPKGFVCHIVPKAEPSDVEKWNMLYRPFSKRSFLQQYLAWLRDGGVNLVCNWQPSVIVESRFDTARQEYTGDLDYEIEETCNGSICQFLREQAIKPIDVQCPVIELLCDVNGKWGLCQTGDEAWILKWFLIFTGSVHFPMLIPQSSILSGKRRPDFLCFVPVTKFQYKKVAILVDRLGKSPDSISAEDKEYVSEGYIVKRLEIDRSNGGKTYFKHARDLKIFLEGL